MSNQSYGELYEKIKATGDDELLAQLERGMIAPPEEQARHLERMGDVLRALDLPDSAEVEWLGYPVIVHAQAGQLEDVLDSLSRLTDVTHTERYDDDVVRAALLPMLDQAIAMLQDYKAGRSPKEVEAVIVWGVNKGAYDTSLTRQLERLRHVERVTPRVDGDDQQACLRLLACAELRGLLSRIEAAAVRVAVGERTK